MDTNQIYAIVNEVNAEAFGSTDIDVVDAQGLISDLEDSYDQYL